MIKAIMALALLANILWGISIKEYTQKGGYDIDRYTKDYSDVIHVLDYYNKNVGGSYPEYSEAIMEASIDYQLDPRLLATVIGNESSYNKHVKHRPCTVKLYKRVHGKMRKISVHVKAIGFGGVIYDAWKSELRRAGISKSMLHDPVYNIRAIAMILRTYANMTNVTNGKTSSMLMRYYGLKKTKHGYSHIYPKRIFSLTRKIFKTKR